MTQDGSLHRTKDGVGGYLSDGALVLDGLRSQYVKPWMVPGLILVILELVLM